MMKKRLRIKILRHCDIRQAYYVVQCIITHFLLSTVVKARLYRKTRLRWGSDLLLRG